MPEEDLFIVTEADLSDPVHQAATLSMMDAYARDAMGDGKQFLIGYASTLLQTA